MRAPHLLLIVSLAVSGSSCAAPRFAIPTGAAVPMADGVATWHSASAVCRDVEAIGLDLRAGGRVAGQRVVGLRFAVALDRHGYVALEARAGAGAAPVFSLRGTSEQATLVLVRERRVVRAPAAAILDALVGLPMSPARLLAVLAGCVSDAEADVVHQIGGTVRVRTADAEVYLVERGDRWVVRAGTFGDFVADYDRGDGPWPTRVSITTTSGRSPDVQLALQVDAVDTRRRDAAVFVPSTPSDMAEASLEWLRTNGPVARHD